MAKISKKKQALIDADHKARLQAAELLISTYHNKIFKATVDWFNNMSGMGMLTVNNSLRLPIYACAIKGRKTWFAETACVYYKPGQIVEIKVTVGALRDLMAEGLTAGHLDVEGWNNIKDRNLAFRCNDSGEAINGLFE